MKIILGELELISIKVVNGKTYRGLLGQEEL